jgi:hypothetical protein
VVFARHGDKCMAGAGILGIVLFFYCFFLLRVKNTSHSCLLEMFWMIFNVEMIFNTLGNSSNVSYQQWC